MMLPKLNRRGVTLVELIIAMAILAVLAAAVIPISEVMVQRGKELELRRSLRLLRTAIDDYKADFDRAVQEKKITKAINETGYPRELEELVTGSDFGGLYPHKRRYLRHLPRDPFDEYGLGWGLRAYADAPDSTIYGGGDIYDVHSQSDRRALDGTSYQDW
jgi:general secretion pathway protein G